MGVDWKMGCCVVLRWKGLNAGFSFPFSFLACLFLSFEIKYISKHSDIKKLYFNASCIMPS